MGLFSSNSNHKKATLLLRTCESIVVSSYEDFAPHSNLIGNLTHEGRLALWDLLMTVAAVGSALMAMEDVMKPKAFQAFFATTAKIMQKWHPQGEQLLKHMIMFMHKREEAGIPRNTSVGTWVISNIKGVAPTQDELAISPMIGDYLQQAMTGWWDRV